jgi:hypothetical protein
MNAGRHQLTVSTLRAARASGAKAGHGLVQIAAMMVVLGALSACTARPVGDFGRAAPSFTHDVAMPRVGAVLAQHRGDPVSDFNQTDQETEMHDRVWRFLVAAHARDWRFDGAVELQRTRITPPTDTRYTIERYYNWLKGTPYQSSRTRYASVGSHIAADLDTIPSTFAAICAVIEVDRQRAEALAGLGQGLAPRMAESVAARKYENNAFIAWFVRALDYRYNSYDFALDNLLVETPHEQSLAVDEELRRMIALVGRAQRHDFCGEGTTSGRRGGPAIPSRFQKPWDNEVVAIK